MLKLVTKSTGVAACCGGKGMGEIGKIGEIGESGGPGEVEGKGDTVNNDGPGYVDCEDDRGVAIEMIWQWETSCGSEERGLLAVMGW